MAPKENSGKIGSGSPANGEPVYLMVGYLRRAHGVHGELVMEVHTDFPERLKPQTGVFVGMHHQPMTIAAVRKHREGLLIKLNGLDTPEDAARYRNQLVYVTAADRPPLPKGRFYYHELIGFDVVNEQENLIGELTEIMQTGANEVYVVKRPDASEVLLPVIPSVVLDIDAERRLIRVHLLPGLLDESED
ncbi:MAG TPA: ribosome maturation factor RimM [Anaerolineales bacterium]|nr:ribosome maturation factor RimM [Anaerolineales bacterium]